MYTLCPVFEHVCSNLKRNARLTVISQFKIESVIDFMQSCRVYRFFDRSTEIGQILPTFTELLLFLVVFNVRKFNTRVRKSRYSGETLQVPIHCCDVSKPPYLFSGELCTSTLHCKLLFVYTVCCRRTRKCFSVLRTRKSDVILT